MVESKGKSRSPTRNITRVKSKSAAAGGGPSRTESKLRALSRGRSASQKDPLNRSNSGGESKLRALSRSRGRSGSPPERRPPNRSKSSASAFGGQRSGKKPPNRSKSFGGEGGRKPPTRSKSFDMAGDITRQPPKRSKSFGAEQDLQKLRRARSTSPTRGQNRSNSKAPSRGNSADPTRNRSRSRSADRFSKTYPSQRPEDNGISRRRLKSFRRLKRIGGGEKEVSWWQLCHYVIPICIILGASVGLMFATGNGNIITDKIDDIIYSFENSEIMDPFIGGSAPHWQEDGNGLRITIINQLSDPWQVTFTLATADWSLGEPDAVEITEEIGVYDKDCEAPDGKIAVCNGDYGDSKWRGVNEAMMLGRFLISSSARMNEFYLFNLAKGAWQYTMCHEIGHALGLAHTDEDFNNKDLGNCMDYTDNLDANKHPDQSNYEKLLEIYGPIGGRRARERELETDDTRSQFEGTKRGSHLRSAVDASVTSVSSMGDTPHVSVKRLRKRDPSNNDSHPDHDDTTQGGGNVTVDIVPDHIRQKKKEAVQKLFQRVKENFDNDDYHNTPVGHTHEDGWQLVHRKLHAEEHETDLGEGYKVRVQFLLVHE